MFDNRGCDRGKCKECIGECDEYMRPSTPDDYKCLYCLCPPTKHEKVLSNEQFEKDKTCNSVVVEKSPLKRNVNESECRSSDKSFLAKISSSLQNDSKKLRTDSECPERYEIYTTRDTSNSINVDVQGKAEFQEYEIPKFSPIIQSALENGTVLSKGYFNNFITECCLHYVNFNNVDNRYSYERIGMAMTNKYPCLKMAGQTDWFQFTKTLSSKIRRERFRRKQSKQRISDNLKDLADIAVSPEGSPSSEITRGLQPSSSIQSLKPNSSTQSSEPNSSTPKNAKRSIDINRNNSKKIGM